MRLRRNGGILKKILRIKKFALYLQPRRGNSSVGRARPCQGRGRGSESRFPLKTTKPGALHRAFLVSGRRKLAFVRPDAGKAPAASAARLRCFDIPPQGCAKPLAAEQIPQAAQRNPANIVALPPHQFSDNFLHLSPFCGLLCVIGVKSSATFDLTFYTKMPW